MVMQLSTNLAAGEVTGAGIGWGDKIVGVHIHIGVAGAHCIDKGAQGLIESGCRNGGQDVPAYKSPHPRRVKPA